MSLRPLKENKATIQLNINKVLKLKRNSSDSYVNMEPEEGDWKFDIPVTKKTSVSMHWMKKLKLRGQQS